MTLNRSIGLWFAVFFPSALFVLAGTSSLAAGAAVACVVTALAWPVGTATALARHGTAVGLAGILLTFIAFHLMVATVHAPVNVPRAAVSMLLLTLFLLGGLSLSHAFFAAPSHDVDRTCTRIFTVFIIVAVVYLSGLLRLGPEGTQVVFPFNEPSHFALAFTPFLMYACLRRDGWRRYVLLVVGLTIAYLIQNLTLVVGCLLVAALCTRAVFAPVLAALVAGAALSLDLGYFTERLNLSTDNSNISTLAYLQGWELLQEGLDRSRGWGIGFQQLGERETAVPIADLIYAQGELELNLRDGAFVLAKLGAEFGAFGIAAAAVLLTAAARAALALRRDSRSGAAPASVQFARCVLVAYAVNLLVREGGYFTGSSLLLIASLMVLWKARRATASIAPSLAAQR
ncbi:MAG: hypothetical protein E6Q93_04675 [Burkholderiaceae bacterium]|nr:MAG: hypothetical protein E6Q93_04675 [Burkholderiaceae bacterium]